VVLHCLPGAVSAAGIPRGDGSARPRSEKLRTSISDLRSPISDLRTAFTIRSLYPIACARQNGVVKPIEHFQFCPRCRHPRSENQRQDAFHCGGCGFLYYFNPATAAAAFLVRPDGTALFIRRAKEPAKGQLALPGGFVDFPETAEDALRREIREEVSLEVPLLDYLCSAPNEYHYQEVSYQVLDLFFVARVEAGVKASALDGVQSYCWIKPAQVVPASLAFPSIRAARSAFLRRLDPNHAA
jgi:ADP-ribose pyrophosphatase YjhB (NUDIX family)